MKPLLREKVLSEWRGLPQKGPVPDRSKPVRDVLTAVMRNFGLQEHLDQAHVASAWKQIVGDFIATHSSPSRLKAGVLYVQVLQPTVRYELERVWKSEILKKLKDQFGARKIRDIRFGLG